jgi:sulfate transport system permease protein
MCNTIFGLAAAWMTTKFHYKGKRVLTTLIDLPVTISPVIAGLIFLLTFGRQSPLYPYLKEMNLNIVFAVPGVLLATIFVTLPFISREIIPVMEAQVRRRQLPFSVQMVLRYFGKSHFPILSGHCFMG